MDATHEPPPENEPAANSDRGRERAFRYASDALRQPTWVHKAIAVVILIILVGIAVSLLVWGLIVGAVLVAVAAVVLGARALWLRSFGVRPHGSSMRRNVRVIRRSESP